MADLVGGIPLILETGDDILFVFVLAVLPKWPSMNSVGCGTQYMGLLYAYDSAVEVYVSSLLCHSVI